MVKINLSLSLKQPVNLEVRSCIEAHDRVGLNSPSVLIKIIDANNVVRLCPFGRGRCGSNRQNIACYLPTLLDLPTYFDVDRVFKASIVKGIIE